MIIWFAAAIAFALGFGAAYVVSLVLLRRHIESHLDAVVTDIERSVSGRIPARFGRDWPHVLARVESLHDMHDQKTADGNYVWYVNMSLVEAVHDQRALTARLLKLLECRDC